MSASRGSEVMPAILVAAHAVERERVRCSVLIDWPVYPRLMPLCESGRADANRA
jgi:hypothetical protein